MTGLSPVADEDGNALERLRAYATHPCRAELPFGRDLLAIADELSAALPNGESRNTLAEELSQRGQQLGEDGEMFIAVRCSGELSAIIAALGESRNEVLEEAQQLLLKVGIALERAVEASDYLKAGPWPYILQQLHEFRVWRAALSTPQPIEGEVVVERMREALTPSGDTKADYMGEFSFKLMRTDENGDDYAEQVYVPWDTIKEIMAAIRARAALSAAPRQEIKGVGEDWETVCFAAKWIERGLYDPQIGSREALRVIARYPGMPWHSMRWDVDHKSYASKFYADFPKAANPSPSSSGDQDD